MATAPNAGGLLPLPPADLASQSLPLVTLRKGTTVFRSHAVSRSALWFGPGPGRAPEYRFDAPGGEYGVLYAGRTDMAAFVETFLRDLPVRAVSRANLQLRAITALTLTRGLRLVRVYGPALVKLGTTAAVAGAKVSVPKGFAGAPYGHSQAWSLALHDHPQAPAGIEYRSSHDDSLLCVALFEDRAAAALGVGPPGRPLASDRLFLASVIRRYGIKLL